jgi:tetratricopeptide (TPR) repeat protein
MPRMVLLCLASIWCVVPFSVSYPNFLAQGPTRQRGERSAEPESVSARERAIPQKAHDAYQKGMTLLYGKSDYQASLEEFQAAVQAFPTYYEAYTQIGIARMKMNDSAGSEQALRKAIELSSEMYSDAYSYLALLFSSNARYADAESLARKAVELDKNSWLALRELGRALYRLNRFEEAEAAGLGAMQLQPNEPSLYLMLADIHLKLQKFQQVVDDLNTYLKLDPNGPDAAHAIEQRQKIQNALAHTPVKP